MRFDSYSQDNTSDVRCEQLSVPGARSGEGTETLWPHLARDELQKMANRGGERRDGPSAQDALHSGRHSTDRPLG